VLSGFADSGISRNAVTVTHGFQPTISLAGWLSTNGHQLATVEFIKNNDDEARTAGVTGIEVKGRFRPTCNQVKPNTTLKTWRQSRHFRRLSFVE